MNLAFASKDLRRLCENEARAEDSLGKAAADALRTRLAQLRAASTVADLVAGRPMEIASNPHARMALQLGATGRLVFSCNHNDVPVDQDGRVAWKQVSRVKIVSVEVSDD